MARKYAATRADSCPSLWSSRESPKPETASRSQSQSTTASASDNAGVPSVEAAKRWRKKRNLPNFDFFNYAGINRSVRLCSTPKDYIEDITLVPSVDGKDGLVRYSVATVGEGQVGIEILSREGEVVARTEGAQGEIRIADANLWNPWPEDPYLYTARVSFAEDVYCEPFGIRTVEVRGHEFLINMSS